MDLTTEDELLEREEQLTALRRALRDAMRGDGRCVLVAGEAGVGKTRLVRHFTRELDPAVRLLAGACDDLRATRPLGAIRDAVRGRQGPLATILATAEPEMVLNGLDADFSGPGSTVLVIEDVHWADEATIDVLHHLIRRIEGWPLLLILTFRGEDLDERPAVRRMLARAVGDPVMRLTLKPLTLDAVERLAAGSGRSGSDLIALTGGNPFYLTEVLAGPSEHIPASIRDVVLARLAGLDPDSIEVVEQLSVIPMSIDAALADVLLGGNLGRSAAAERLGILTVDTAHGHHSVAFRHELARRAVESELSALRRRRLNQRVLDAMLAAPERPELARLVHHAVEAGAVQQIAEFAPAAGREAARAGAHGEALSHFELALRHREKFGENEVTELLDAYSFELYLAGQYGRAVAIGNEAVARRSTDGDSVELAEALVRLSRSQFLNGDTTGAIASADRAVAVASNTGSQTAQAAAATEQSIIGVLSGLEHDEAVRRLTAAHAAAIDVRRADLAALCLNYLGVAHCDAGNLDGIRILRESLAVARAAEAHEATGRAYINLSQMLYRLERWDELEEILSAGLDYAHEHALWGNALDIELHSALLLVRRGKWREAEAIYAKVREELTEHGRQYLYLLMFEARLVVRRGHPDAEERLRLVRAEAERQQSPVGLAYAGLAMLEWCWLHDREDLARETWTSLDRREGSPLFAEAERYYRHTQGEALPDWPEAAARWRQLDERYDEAVELAMSGDVQAAIDAHRVFAGLGAVPATRRVRRLLQDRGVAKLPRTPAASTTANPAGLTARQLRIAQLLANQLTNAAIADELVLSIRTVDHHVSAVLAKLQVGSRRDVAERLRELGLQSD